jgi:hypothetical protein
MKVRILGCSGGIGGRHLRTTSLLVDNDILIDAGTGVGDLAIAELAQIDHVFITHSHLDHLACMPFMIDTVGDMRNRPLTVHATEATLEIIRAHIFNWAIWPDFSVIPTPEKPFMRFATIRVGEAIDIDGRKVVPLPANHTVPAVGYQVDSGQGQPGVYRRYRPLPGALAVRQPDPQLALPDHRVRVFEQRKWLAQASLHLCPSMLLDELTNLQRDAEVFITHLKPGQIELTMQEIEDCIGEFRPGMLQNNQLFEI